MSIVAGSCSADCIALKNSLAVRAFFVGANRRHVKFVLRVQHEIAGRYVADPMAATRCLVRQHRRGIPWMLGFHVIYEKGDEHGLSPFI